MKSKLIMLLVMMLMLCQVVSADTIDQPIQDDVTGSLTISGQIDGYGYADAFTLAVFKSGKSYSDITEYTPEELMSVMTHFGTYMTDAEGNYEIAYSTKTLDAGDYTVVLTTKDGTKYDKPIFIASRDSKIKFIGEVAELVDNGCTATQLKDKLALTDETSVNAKVFEILKDSVIFAVDADGLSEVALYNIKETADFEDTDPEEFVTFLEKCAFIQSVNEGKINPADKAEFFELDEAYMETYDEYVSSDEKEKFTDYLKGEGYNTTEEIAKAFNTAVVENVLKNADAWADYKAIIEAHGEDLDIDMDDYEDFNSTKKNKISSYMKNSYNDVDDFVDDVNDAIDDIKRGKSSGGGGGGSSFGKGTSGITGVDVNNYPIDMTPQAEPVKFTDLEGFDWAKEAIEALSDEGVVSGIGGGKFAPEANVTREQFVKMIVDAFDVKATDSKVDFADVESGAWYEQYVYTAAQNGIVSGIGDGKFGVGANITRQDAAVILYNVAPIIVENGKLDFADADEISGYAKEAVKQLSTFGVISGTGDGSFDPKATCTRAQAAVMIYRLLDQISK